MAIENEAISVVISNVAPCRHWRQIGQEMSRDGLYVLEVADRKISSAIKMLPMRRARRRPVANEVLIETPTVTATPHVARSRVRAGGRRECHAGGELSCLDGAGRLDASSRKHGFNGSEREAISGAFFRVRKQFGEIW